MKVLLDELKMLFTGEILYDKVTRTKYSHDASMYELVPEAVLCPQDSNDIKKLVRFVNAKKHAYPTLSITPRSAGTDVSGGAIGPSFILDMTKHFDSVHSVSSTTVHVQPGVPLRTIKLLLLAHGAMMGSAPASHATSTIGGMIANNSAGEQSLRYGNADKSVQELKVILADGNEYSFKPMTKRELAVKIKQNDFEGTLYRRTYELIEQNYDLIKNARPKVSKNSMGYSLWNVWDRDTGIFDLTQLFTGSQGTLGIITDITIRTVPKAKHSGLLLTYLENQKHLGAIIPLIASHSPATFEGFDDVTFSLGMKHFTPLYRQLGMKTWIKQQTTRLPSVANHTSHLPGTVLMIEFEGRTYQEVNDKIVALQRDLDDLHLGIRTEIEGNEEQSQPFWNIRRNSLDALRKRAKSHPGISFVDDLAVPPQHIAVFLPRMRKIIRHYKLPVTIAGHFGDGNFHIIPLFDTNDQALQAKLELAMRELVPIILEYGGTLAGEHNDGMIRGPWLPAMFGNDMYELFKDTKELFDPLYIFNPHKKTDASWEFSTKHIRNTIKEKK